MPASEFRRVATPEGLRRLTSIGKFRTRRYATGRLPEDPTGSSSMHGSGSIDLEAGRRGDGVLPVAGVLQKALKALVRRCRRVLAMMCGGNRRRWIWPVMALEAMVIVALVLRVRRDAAGGAGRSMERCVRQRRRWWWRRMMRTLLSLLIRSTRILEGYALRHFFARSSQHGCFCCCFCCRLRTFCPSFVGREGGKGGGGGGPFAGVGLCSSAAAAQQLYIIRQLLSHVSCLIYTCCCCCCSCGAIV